MHCVMVSHTHWDREWYRTFQSFRARLVDTVDRVLDLVRDDSGFHFQLDGQTIVLEDYLAVRPERRDELAAAVDAGRIAIGPWYVQPDSFLPSGEAHVRNLLEGRRVASAYGRCESVAYTPDSFGHPAQFPQIFAGFGLGPFIYWRGNGNEIAELPAEYRWLAPDGSEVIACHLGQGYFNANGLPDDVGEAAERLQKVSESLAERAPRDCVLLMNGVDHMLPDTNTREVSEALAKQTGWVVQRGLLGDYSRDVSVGDGPHARFEGELCGGRVANLLPGVWSTRTYLKLRNRLCESTLEGWAEPWSVIGQRLGTPPEQASLRIAWRELLANQAHDSICGCSQDAVHDQMLARYDVAEELARETTQRSLERIAGLGADRQIRTRDLDTGRRRRSVSIAVFNPSPHPRTEVVRLPLDGFPSNSAQGVNPLLSKNHQAQGFTMNGDPARLIRDEGNVRPLLAPDQPVYDIEFIARDVPGFGWSRFELARSDAWPEQEDDGREIGNESLRLLAADDGTLTLETDGRSFSGLAALEDTGDRGDTYDYDPVPATSEAPEPGEEAPRITRFRHPAGIERLVIERSLIVPDGLSEDRRTRANTTVSLPVRIEARVAAGVPRVDLDLRIENRARDHRLRILFPTGSRSGSGRAGTTFDATPRQCGRPDDSDWIHPAPDTFPMLAWAAKDGLNVFAPGLNEAEITPEGALALTLLRATGWLSRPDLATRPGDAGPALVTPGAQCLGPLRLRLALGVGDPDRAPGEARDAELGLSAVAAGDEPLWPAATPLLELAPRELVLSAWKPAESGDGSVLRVLNPTDRDRKALLSFGSSCRGARCVRLDETRVEPEVNEALEIVGDTAIALEVPAHALRSIWLPG
jgi:hypothetical protein